MTLPTSLGAYRDCEALFLKATEGKHGARAKLASQEACINLRSRLHYYRTLDRAANAETYPKGHPQHGQSVYDDYTVQIIPDADHAKTGEHWVYISKRSNAILALETLDDGHNLLDDVEYHEIKQVEDHTNG